MKSEHLTLRQRKLLNYLQSQTALISGNQLAQYLHVSVRTIRNDITEINAILDNAGIRIVSHKGKGYELFAKDPEILKELIQKNSSFATKEDRVRYLAFTLCLSQAPVNTYDLEEEMYVSHTTLEHDIHQLKVQYVLSSPRIELFQKKGYLEFESDERKRRAVLNHLFRDGWNYNTRDNAYYSYEYLDADRLAHIMIKVDEHMHSNGIWLEDTDLVSLNMAIAIMYQRCISGFHLTGGKPDDANDPLVQKAISNLLNDLDKDFHYTTSDIERNEIYLMAAHNRLMNANELNFQTVEHYFSDEVRQLADNYLNKVNDVFHINFRPDEDFYITLLQYLRYLKLPYHSFNNFQLTQSISRKNLLIEFEIAALFQQYALDYLGYYLNHTELVYLAFCFAGAMETMNHNNESLLQTAICCHLNLYASWALKRKLLADFGNYIHVNGLLPVNTRKIFDFSETDLVLTTVKKPITNCPTAKVLYISPFLTPVDKNNLESCIYAKRIEKLYTPSRHTLYELLSTAYWHECIRCNDRFSLISQLMNNLIEQDCADKAYYEDVLRRESISTFAFQPGIALIYSLKPAKRTQLSVATLEHRITWNSYKIRTVIAAALAPEDMPLIFHLVHQIYGIEGTANDCSHLKTKEDLLEYFENR